MREPMHPIYTAVPARSVVAYAKSGPAALEEVLCAAIVDPANAEDAFEEYGVIRTPHSLRDFWEWRGAKGVDLALQVAAQWTMEQGQAQEAILSIFVWDERLGAWCACQAAREALRFVPESERRPRIAVETTEKWVMGNATRREVCDASNDAFRAASAVRIANSLYEASYSAYAISSAVCGYSANAARSAVSAVVGIDGIDDFSNIREVVAEACMTFPRYYSR